MKQEVLKMMRLFAVAAVVTIIIHSCKKESISSTENLTIENGRNASGKFNIITDIAIASPFNKRVGAPINDSTGASWIGNYQKMHGQNMTYYLNSGYLQKILIQPNCVGICLYYAQDANKKVHIIPIGVSSVGKKMKQDMVVTSQCAISWATAQEWIANDKGIVDAHFFGSNTFERLNLNGCETGGTIRVEFAIDNKNKPQLLLTNPCIFNIISQYEDLSRPCSATNCPQ